MLRFTPSLISAAFQDDAVIIAVDQTGTVTDIERRSFSDAAAIDVAKTLTTRP